MRTTFVCSKLLIFTRDRKPHRHIQDPANGHWERGIGAGMNGVAELAARNAPEARAGPDRATSGGSQHRRAISSLLPIQLGRPAAQARTQSAGGHCHHRPDGRAARGFGPALLL